MNKLINFKEKDSIVLILGVTICGFVYYFLHGIYAIYDIDNAWVLSNTYYYLIDNIQYDKVFGAGSGFYFAKTHAWLYGSILNIFGWELSNARIISTILIWMSALLWFFLLLKMGYSRNIAFAFILLFLILEPNFAAANKARVDALVFFLVSLATFLAVYKAFFISGIVSMVALETHLMGGAMSGIYVLAYLLSNYRAKDKRSAWWLYSLGLIIGIFYYLAFHHENLSEILSIVAQATNLKDQVNHYLYAYFFTTKYYRHIPELVVISISCYIFIAKKLYRTEQFVGIFILLVLISTFIIRRPNFHYAIYAYPAFILLIVVVSKYLKHSYLSVALIFAMLLPQYGFVYFKYNHFEFNEYLKVIRKSVPKDDLPVVGYSTHWFAFYNENRDFFAINYQKDVAQLSLKDFYLIDDSQHVDSYSISMADFIKDCDAQVIFETTFDSSVILTKKMICQQREFQ